MKPDISILQNIQKQDIELIKIDVELKTLGYKAFYIVDTYDIIGCAFPDLFNDGNTFALENKIESTYYIAYDNLFFRYPNKPIVLDQYKSEIDSIWNDMYQFVSRYSNRNDRDKFVKHFINVIKEAKDDIVSKVTLLISFSLGLLSDLSVNRFKTIINKRLQIDDFKTQDVDDQRIIEEIFFDSQPSETVDIIFNEFCEKNKMFFSGLKEEKDVEIYLENTYRDIEVFDRVIQINKKISSEKRLKNKYVFYYLSSASFKSPKVSNLYSELNLFPKFEGNENVSIWRNISQFYFTELLNATSNDSKVIFQQLERCEAIFEHYSKREALIEKLSGEFSSPIERFNSTLERSRRNLEDIYSLYNLFASYKDKTLQAIQQLQNGADSDLKKTLSELFSYLQNNKIEKEKVLFALENYDDEHDVQNDMLKFFTSFKKLKEEKKISITAYAGKDVIRSHVQLYPILLFYNEFSTANSDMLQELLLHVISANSLEKEFVINKYTRLRSHDFFALQAFERKIFTLLLKLILPKGASKDGHSHPSKMDEDRVAKELMIIKELNKLRSINEKKNIKREIVESFDNGISKINLSIFFFPAEKTKCEIDYFLSWMYRRMGNYEDCLRVIGRGNISTMDPRFHYSRSLCLISIAYSNDKLNEYEKIKLFYSAIKDLEIAKEHFESDLIKKNKLIPHVIVGINNTICDAYIQIYLLKPEGNEELILNIARPILKGFRYMLIDQLKEDYSNYPTYNHTEADLEYCEALIAFKNNDFNLALTKIGLCENRFLSIKRIQILEGYQYLGDSAKRIKNLSKKIQKEIKKS